jgi:cytoskeletal protein RodZ
MRNEKKNLGEILATRRKEMNLSLKEIEGALSIRTNYLQAIEEGQLGKLISPVHAQGFVKQYATFLGLDGDKLLKEQGYGASLPGMRQEFAYGIGTMEMRTSQGGNVRSFPGKFWVILLMALVGAAWFVARVLEFF